MSSTEDGPSNGPTRELKDIALQSAGAADRAEEAAKSAEQKVEGVDLLSAEVSILSSSIKELNETFSEAALKSDVVEAQRRTRRALLAPTIVGAIALLLPAVVGLALLRVGSENHTNNKLIVFCTTPPPANADVAEQHKYECYLRGQRSQAEAVRQLECNDLLTKGYWVPPCDDVRKTLEAQGIVLPPTAAPPPALGHPAYPKPSLSG